MVNQAAKAHSGAEISWRATHRDKNDYLISGQLKRGRWFNYFFGTWDTKRAVYCGKHPHNTIPLAFRSGSLNLRSAIFTLRLIKSGEWNELS